jgi:hypothetical protein
VCVDGGLKELEADTHHRHLVLRVMGVVIVVGAASVGAECTLGGAKRGFANIANTNVVFTTGTGSFLWKVVGGAEDEGERVGGQTHGRAAVLRASADRAPGFTDVTVLDEWAPATRADFNSNMILRCKHFPRLGEENAGDGHDR